MDVAQAPAPEAPRQGILLGLLLVFLAGMGASLTPCVYPMIPITMAVIGAKGGLPWLSIIPEAAYWGIRLASEQLGSRRLPIFMSENGLSDSATADATGLVSDVDRIAYTRAYLRQVLPQVPLDFLELCPACRRLAYARLNS